MPWLRRTPSSPEDKFATEIIDLFSAVLGLKAQRLDGFALRIERPGETPVTMNLHNIYAEARQLSGQARAEQLRRAVLSMTPTPRPASWDDAAPRLLPAVRTASWINAAPPGTSVAVPFGKPLVPFVKVVCAVDSEHAISFATIKDLGQWGVTDDEALRTATVNLTRMPCKVARSGPLAIILGPDGYASSWLAAPSALAGIAREIGSSVIAVATTRDQLTLIDTGDPEATVRMLEAALKDYQEATRQLSPVPYLVSDTGIQPWTPPPGHPARSVVDKAAHHLAAVEYAYQKSMLEDRLEKAGEDVFVASHTLMKAHDGSLWSWSPWVRQVTNGLLPQVDILLLGDNDQPDARFAVTWDDAHRIAGHALKEEAEYDPPRWRHHGWPQDATLEALRANATPFPPS